jgi:uncharacterized membrane protein
MLIAAIFAPFVLLVLFFILGGFLVAAYERGDKMMMKFWGVIVGMVLIVLIGSFWIYHQIDLHF